MYDEGAMTFGETLDYLESLGTTMMNVALTRPHSYRGYYHDLAVTPISVRVTAWENYRVLSAALNETFEGWKGGEYTMHRSVDVYLSSVGKTGEPLTREWLTDQISDAASTTNDSDDEYVDYTPVYGNATRFVALQTVPYESDDQVDLLLADAKVVVLANDYDREISDANHSGRLAGIEHGIVQGVNMTLMLIKEFINADPESNPADILTLVQDFAAEIGADDA